MVFWMRLFLPILGLLVFPWGSLADPHVLPLSSVEAELERLKEVDSPFWSPQLFEFYRRRDFRPGWLVDGGPGSQVVPLVRTLRNADLDGLCPEEYHLDTIEALLAGSAAWSAQDSARFDLLLSDAFLRYASHLSGGRVDPNVVLTHWKVRPHPIDPVQLLTLALQDGTPVQRLAALEPTNPGYAALRKALADYRRLEILGGWPLVPDGPKLEPGQDDPRLPVLRRRLQVSGDLPEAGESGDRFDPATVAAVKAFQSRHGLATDGVLGPHTLAVLNVPVGVRRLQLELNLERWRWLPQDLGERYLLVNIAAFRLDVVVGGVTVLSMPAVVGTSFRQTPVFSGRLTHLEFSPYWYVPPTILREDLLPKLRKDPSLLAKRHFEVVGWRGGEILDPAGIDWRRVTAEHFPGQIRQQPGPWNPLGRVKFLFPNEYSVYLHDTPEPALFSKEVRSFSSGCIRIAQPLALAALLLGDNPTPLERDYLAGHLPETPQRIAVPKPLPVHILYWTAWVDADGILNFRDDLYWRDLDLEMALAETAGSF